MNNSNTYRNLAGLLLAGAGLLFAIDPDRATSQYVRDHWGTERGFPRGSVYAITQTTDGYLWIGTEAGLVRFDGLNFTLQRDAALPSEAVVGLAPDREGGLWIRLADMTLAYYLQGKFKRPPAWDNSNVTAIAEGSAGGLLAARRQLGVLTSHLGEPFLEVLAPGRNIPRSPITAVIQNGASEYWLGTRGSGLFRVDPTTTTGFRDGLPDLKINCLLNDGNSRFWIGTDDGIARWTGSALTVEGVPAELRHGQMLALTKDRDGNLWIGTDTGRLLRFNSHGVFAVEAGDGESANALTTIFEDREGNIWWGSANGIGRLRDSTFVSYSSPEGLPTDGSNPLYVDDEQRLWFAPAAGGVWWVQKGEHGAIAMDGLDRDIVYSIAGGGNELWLGRQRGGLTRLRRTARGGWEAKTFTKADGLAQNSVYSVFRSPTGVVWAGTLSGGVSRLEQGIFKTFSMADGLSSNTVVSLLEAADGTMWVATPGALNSFSNGRWRVFTHDDGLPSTNVNCLLEDSKGILWAGTTAGLAFLKDGRFVVPRHGPGALAEQILGLAEDKGGAFWMATSNHVIRVKRDELIEGTPEVREYGLADGLRGVEGVKRHQSVVKDTAGRIWFSLNYGISVVDPARVTASSAPAIVHIQALSADGSPISTSGEALVPPGRQRVVFGFAGLSLSSPERVVYRYRLENNDRDWSRPSADREASYTNLVPGLYRFHVVASNPDGTWSQEASLALMVEPRYWQTWWFRSSLVLALGLGVAAVYRMRLNQLTAQLNLRFEERLAERTRIAQELHDTLLQGFLSASMHVHLAADRLPGDSPLKPGLTRALEMMRQVIDEGRNAVRGLRSTQSSSLDLEQAFSRIQEELPPAAEAVNFRVVAEGVSIPLHPLVRDEVFSIGREALRNAFRHAHAKHIEIEVNYSPSALRIVVRDDGCGIDPVTLKTGRDGHFGLSGMRERADRIGARLRLLSNVNTGTEVELAVPGHIAFLNQSNSRRNQDDPTHTRS